MMVFVKIGILLLLALVPFDPLKVATWNAQKRDGVKAFEAGRYAEAIAHFSRVVETGGGDAALYLNLGHAHYLTGNMEMAMQFYGMAAQGEAANLKSIGQHQLGVIYAKNKENPKALQAFKEALKSDPTNEPARINYELLKKKMEQENPDQQNQDQQNNEQQQQKEQQDKKDQDKQDNDQQQQDNNQQDSQQQEGEPKDPQQTDQKERQVDEQQSKIEKERAKMILKDLEQQEKQFYQQFKRKSENKKTGKPDW